jgi:hypothetical protein
MSKRNTHETVEGWFQALMAAARPLFEEIGYRLPESIQIDFGFTSHGKRKGPRGEFWDKEASSNRIPRMIIRCDSAEIGKILDSFAHQCVHAVVGAAAGHEKPFRDCALRLGMEGKMREAVPGKRLAERLHALAEEVGTFPGGALDFEKRGYDGEEKKQRVVVDVEEKQKSRQLKAECLIDDCGYIARVSAMNLRRGAPICPIHKQSMWHEALDPEIRQKQEVGGAPATDPDLVTQEPVKLISYQPEDAA